MGRDLFVVDDEGDIIELFFFYVLFYFLDYFFWVVVGVEEVRGYGFFYFGVGLVL